MKYVTVILDGAADWPIESLGRRSALQAARTPHLDALARAGLVGCAQTVPVGSEPSSSAACMSILGYDPVADYVGRGAIEAASMGIALRPDQIALRMNLVSIYDGVMSSYSAGNITSLDSHAIVAELVSHLSGRGLDLHPGVAYRHILVVSGHPELLETSFTPPHDISDRNVAPYLPKGPGSDLVLQFMEDARPILAQSAVNARRVASGQLAATDVWLFWPGVAPAGLVPFAERRGVRAAMTSGVDLLNGLAALTGIARLDIDGVTGDASNDYAAQAEGALAALDEYDLVVVHVESPDEEGHAGDALAKVSAIEAIDREIVARLRAYAASHELRVLAMPDHPTPIEIKTHVGEAVPFVIAGPGVSANGAGAFDEFIAEGTGVRVDPGRGVMDLLLGWE